jgi:hypothetical protein
MLRSVRHVVLPTTPAKNLRASMAPLIRQGLVSLVPQGVHRGEHPFEKLLGGRGRNPGSLKRDDLVSLALDLASVAAEFSFDGINVWHAITPQIALEDTRSKREQNCNPPGMKSA